MRRAFLCASLLAVAACVSDQGQSTEKPIGDYPEAHAHMACLDRRAREFASMPGNAVDLAYVAASGCKQTRYKLAVALGGSRTFVDAFVRDGIETDTQLVAEQIIRIRAGL